MMNQPKDPLEPLQFPAKPGSTETIKAPPSRKPSEPQPTEKTPSTKAPPQKKNPSVK